MLLAHVQLAKKSGYRYHPTRSASPPRSPPRSCRRSSSNAHVRSRRRSPSCRRFAASGSRQSRTRYLPGAIHRRNAVVTHLPPTSCMAVGGAKRGTRRGERLRECHTEHRLVERSHKAVARGCSPACAQSGRRATTAVTQNRRGTPFTDPSQPLSGSGVRIRRTGCFKPTQS